MDGLDFCFLFFSFTVFVSWSSMTEVGMGGWLGTRGGLVYNFLMGRWERRKGVGGHVMY